MCPMQPAVEIPETGKPEAAWETVFPAAEASAVASCERGQQSARPGRWEPAAVGPPPGLPWAPSPRPPASWPGGPLCTLCLELFCIFHPPRPPSVTLPSVSTLDPTATEQDVLIGSATGPSPGAVILISTRGGVQSAGADWCPSVLTAEHSPARPSRPEHGASEGPVFVIGCVGDTISLSPNLDECSPRVNYGLIFIFTD